MSEPDLLSDATTDADVSAPAEPSAVVEVVGLVKHYGDVTALAGVDLAVRHGEVLGLLGPNGAGKTTLLETILGLRVPDRGSVKVMGLDPRRNPDSIRRIAALQPQSAALFPNLTVRETLELWASFYPAPADPDELIARLGLQHKARARVKSLSGGQERRLLLGVTLASNAALLFLDEPTGALDPQARRHVWGIIGEHVERGGTVCLSTHSMEEAATVCGRVAILDGGKVLTEGSPRSLVQRFSTGATVRLRFSTAPSLEACRAVSGVTLASSSLGPAGSFEVSVSTTGAEETVKALLSMPGCMAETLVVQPGTLEDVFLCLTGRELREED